MTFPVCLSGELGHPTPEKGQRQQTPKDNC